MSSILVQVKMMNQTTKIMATDVEMAASLSVKGCYLVFNHVIKTCEIVLSVIERTIGVNTCL